MKCFPKYAVYVLIPTGVTLALVLAYFSGIPALQHLVVPELHGVHPGTFRELGLLENLQHGILLGIAVILIMGYRRRNLPWERVGLSVALAGTLFVLLEEIDYGLHYVELLRHTPPEEAAAVRNIHNIGDITDIIKTAGDLGLAFYFVLFPLLFHRTENPRLRYVVPDRWAALTVVSMVCVSSLAHELRDQGVGDWGYIHKNISEFRELMVYYLIIVYIWDLIFRRRYAPRENGSEGV